MKILRALAYVLFSLSPIASTLATNWQVVRSPNSGQQANSLASVAAAGDNDVWAVGWAFNQQLNAYRTQVQHWDGVLWSLVKSPNATNGYNFLNGVAVVAANDVWAVGQGAIGSTYSTLIEHWDGRAWTIVPSPNTPGLSNVLQAITVISANDIWAVGYATDSSTFNNFTLTLHWNGVAWSIVPSPIFNDDLLFAVAAVASNDVWAVGRSFQDARTLTIHWDGANWSIVPSPNGIGDNILFGVAAIASNDVWAVGNAGSLSTLAEHWNGTAWSIVGTPDFNSNATNQVLVGIVALSDDNIWTAGQYIVPIEGSAQQTLTENWDGTNWNFIPSPDKRNSNNRLHGITVTPNGTLWSVGTTGVFAKPERTLILQKAP